jgi:hypothetical protein
LRAVVRLGERTNNSLQCILPDADLAVEVSAHHEYREDSGHVHFHNPFMVVDVLVSLEVGHYPIVKRLYRAAFQVVVVLYVEEI